MGTDGAFQPVGRGQFTQEEITLNALGWQERRRKLSSGLGNGINTLPVGQDLVVPGVIEYQQQNPQTCLIACALACSGLQPRSMISTEQKLVSSLGNLGLMDNAGVRTADNIEALSELFDKELGITLAQQNQDNPSDFSSGQQIVETLTSGHPLLMCYETEEGSGRGTWVVLKGLKRLGDHPDQTEWIIMEPHGQFETRINTAELARRIVGNAGFVPELWRVNRTEGANQVFKSVNRSSIGDNKPFTPLGRS